MKTAIFGSSLFAATTIAFASSVLVPTSAQAFSVQFGQNSTSSNSIATGASAFVDFSFTQVGNDVQIGLGITNTTGDTIFGAGATSSKLTGIGFDLLAGLSVVNGSFANT
ncbi:MAG: hypothetical protein WA896_16105, partial [Spirulinaceae cyanobacterium]